MHVAPCVAGPHTAQAVIFNPVASTHQGVHLYLLSTGSAVYGCGKLPDISLRMRRESYCLEGPRSDRHIPRPADGRLRLMAWLFRRSHTQWYPSLIGESVTGPCFAPRGSTAVPGDLDTNVGRLLRTGPISLASTGSQLPHGVVVQAPVTYNTGMSARQPPGLSRPMSGMTSLTSHQNARMSIAATAHRKPGRYNAT